MTPWLTSAIPMENSYCSCMLTRVAGVYGQIPGGCPLSHDHQPPVPPNWVHGVGASAAFPCGSSGVHCLSLPLRVWHCLSGGGLRNARRALPGPPSLPRHTDRHPGRHRSAKTVPLPCVFQSLSWRRQCLCLVCSRAFHGEDSAFALCVPLLFVAKTVPLPFVFQSLPRLKHCLSLRFPGDYTACKAYATGQLHFDWACLLPPCAALGVYQTSATGLSFYAVSAFFYTANGIEPPGGLVGLSGPGQALSLASIEAAGMAYCTRHWATILNASSSNGTYEAAYCFSASYIVALLGTGAALNSQLVVHIMLRPSALALDVCRPVPALIFPTPCRLRAPSCCLLRADCSAPCSPLPHPTCRSQLPSTRECTAALSEHPFPIAARVGCPQGTSLTRRTITP